MTSEALHVMTMKQILLGVNIDHIATLRQTRGTRYPDPVQAAIESEHAGADSVTLHLREDRRHIQERDVELLKEILQTRMNLEMAVTSKMMTFAELVRPENCCLVPERREELTTEGGLDVAGNRDAIRDACARLASAGIVASLFIDADFHQIEAAAETAAPFIEIHTGHYADARDEPERRKQLTRIIESVEYATNAGLQVNAGHGLHYHNVSAVAAIPGIKELNIGHAIICRALFIGMGAAVREMKTLMTDARRT
ncbi:MAG: pyridoxine 5-phosphate synthase [Gammaproteobacteria bacterium]|nr:MAG: pyridoxine 5-phosphate synthase [Gammaproteobacteria bacterium]TND06918.1 MAG: pyridoxine 5-phosphate synthase [Gammaproteobacteria bacterium]